jgi:hypothetical protein
MNCRRESLFLTIDETVPGKRLLRMVIGQSLWLIFLRCLVSTTGERALCRHP